jgi:C1A family cysteine protease
MGWIPSRPDLRDYAVQQGTVKKLLTATKVLKLIKDESALPTSVSDLEKYCTPVEYQGKLGACTAHAGVGLVEFFENKTFGKYSDKSRLFLYKTTRNLLHLVGDTGADIRSTLAALIFSGVPPEEYWPYTDGDNFDAEPSAFCYSLAQNYKTVIYYRYDLPGVAAADLLVRIKTQLAAGLPSMFGFSIYSSYTLAEKNGGKIPFPASGESQKGGHAVCAIGYDDGIRITNAAGSTTDGALRIRNSWSEEWGQQGYGWLPYEYVLQGLAIDWWSIIKNEWVDISEFAPEKVAK